MDNLPTRNNNPGDLKNPSTGKFNVFGSPQEGFGALLNDLQIKIKKHPDHTLADFANQYAPPSDNNDTAQYTANLANKLRVAPNTPIGSLQPRIGDFANAVASNEGFMGANKLNTNTPNTSNIASYGEPGSLKGAELEFGPVVDYLLGHKEIVGGGLTAVSTLVGGSLFGPPGAIGGEVAGNVASHALGLEASNPTTTQNQNNVPPRSSPLSLLGTTDANSNSKKLSSAITESLGTTIGNRQILQDPKSQEAIQAMGMFGLSPEVDKNGSQDWSKSIQKSKDIVGGLAGQIGGVIATEGTKGSFKRVTSEAKRIAHERLPEYEWANADKHISQAIQAYKHHKNDQAGLEVFHKIRHDTGSGAKWGLLDTSSKREAFKALSMASRKEVEKNTKNPELYNATLKMEQNLINAQNIMKRLNGKKGIKKEGLLKALLHGAGNVAGAYIGDKIGGTMGAIIGYLVENNVSRSVEKRLGRTIFETPGMRKALQKLQSDSPEYYKILLKKLEENNPVIEEAIDKLETKQNKGKDTHQSPMLKAKEKAPIQSI